MWLGRRETRASRLRRERAICVVAAAILGLVASLVPVVIGSVDKAAAADPPQKTVCQFGTGCREPESNVQRPPVACGGQCIEGIRPTVAIGGRITNGQGQPIGGAEVWWRYGLVRTSTQAADLGRFTITVWADAPVTLAADHDLYRWQTREIPNPVLVPAPAVSTDLILGYLLDTGVSPASFNQPGTALSFETLSTAPRETERAIVQRSDGTIQAMDYVATSGGVSKYTATWTLPVGLAQARYPYRSCIVRESAHGATCDTTISLLSEVANGDYVFDTDAPLVSTQLPAPDHNTLQRRPTISATLTDALSGLNTESLSMKLDGAAVNAELNVMSGVFGYTPAAGLALDVVHTVELTAADKAGNVRTGSWHFNVAALTTTPGSASLPDIVVHYPPLAESVTFPTVPVDVTPWGISLSSSMSGGAGSVALALPTNQATVVFLPAGQNAAKSAPYFPIGATSVRQDFAVLAPATTAIEFGFNQRTHDVGPVTLAVPPAYRATGGDAVLSLESTLANVDVPVGAPGGDPLPSAVPCDVAAQCHVRGSLSCSVVSTGGTGACTTSAGPVYLNAVGGPRNLPVLKPPAVTLDAGPFAPTYEPDNISGAWCGTGVACANLLGAPGRSLKAVWSLGSLFSVFGYNYWYSMTRGPLDPRVIAGWQQVNAHPGTATCAIGSTKLISAKLVSVGQSIEATDDQWVLSGNRQATTNQTPIDERGFATVDLVGESGSYRLGGQFKRGESLGAFDDASGQAYSLATGSLTPTSRGAFNSWTPSPDYQQAAAHGVMTITEYSGPTNLAQFGFQNTINFDFLYSNSACDTGGT